MLTAVMINGMLMGAVYGGIAVGLSLIFGVMKIINFAHGSLVMIAAFISYWLWTYFRVGPLLSGLVAAAFLFLLGHVVQSTLIMPLFRRERAAVVEPISVLLMSCALWLILDNLALLLFGANFRVLQGYPLNSVFSVGGSPVSAPRLQAMCMAFALTVAVHFLLTYTETGRAIRATSQDRDAAALYGINVPKIYAVTFAIGSAVVGFVGVFLASFLYVHPSMGGPFEVKAFIIVVLGGMGSTFGALIGGLLMGLIEAVAGFYTTSVYGQMLFLVVFIITLVVRPQGMFVVSRGRAK